MQNATLKIKNYASAVAHKDNFRVRVLVFKSILFGFAFFAVLYLLLVGSIILSIVDRNNFENKARVLSAEVADLELAYLDASFEIDLEYSYSIGFTQVEKQFATRRHLSMGDFKLAKNEL